jgi:diaminopimelate epimerase
MTSQSGAASTGFEVIATYGHGTENDFFVFFDPTDELKLTEEFISELCSRKTGVNGAGDCYGQGIHRLGADGVIRIVREPAGSRAEFFMDYRNSDGSIAQMCGNGIRVMARYLVERGILREGIFAINTRAGMKFLSVPADGEISVNMGQLYEVGGEITVSANGHTWSGGVNVDVGNPHAVVVVDDLNDVGSLIEKPIVEPADEYPEGVNVEFITFLDNGEIGMRVFERGVGETRSCGTGTCAVALAATKFTKKRLPVKWIINPPGGRLSVEIDSHSNATMTGPAILVGDVNLTELYRALLSHDKN